MKREREEDVAWLGWSHWVYRGGSYNVALYDMNDLLVIWDAGDAVLYDDSIKGRPLRELRKAINDGENPIEAILPLLVTAELSK
jgi:hypothetical protein